jgi:hypothetical protein
MKKIYAFILSITTFTSYAQLSENFDSSLSLPTGWIAFRGTNGLGSTQDWKVSSVHNFSSPNCANVTYENVSGGFAEDWLVTPLVDLTNRSASSLSFYGGQHFSSNYGTVYKVKVSTTSQTNHASFTDIATYGEADFVAGATTSLKTIDLSAYNGQQIYIAFVMIQDDGDYWYIDNVNVTGTLSINEFINNLDFTIYPNPTNNFVNIVTKENIEKIEVYDILGKIVKVKNKGVNIDLSDLSKGIYALKVTTIDGKIAAKKIIKK